MVESGEVRYIGNMTKCVDAVFESGMFRPTTEVDLKEGQRVMLRVEPPMARIVKREPTGDWDLERAWLGAHRRDPEFLGKWVALDGDRVLAYGDDLIEVSKKSKAMVELPLFIHMPKDADGPWHSW